MLRDKDNLYNNLMLIFKRVEYVNIDVTTGRLKDWIIMLNTLQFAS